MTVDAADEIQKYNFSNKIYRYYRFIQLGTHWSSAYEPALIFNTVWAGESVLSVRFCVYHEHVISGKERQGRKYVTNLRGSSSGREHGVDEGAITSTSKQL